MNIRTTYNRCCNIFSLLVGLILLGSCGTPALVQPVAPATSSPLTVEHRHHLELHSPEPTSSMLAQTPVTMTPLSTTARTSVEFSGTGEGASDPFPLQVGLALFRYTHPTDTPFAIYLLNEQGDHLALLANAATAITATQVIGITAAGPHRLHIIAEDAWQAKVEQLNPAELQERAEQVQLFQGRGPAVSAPVKLPAGPIQARWTHDGALLFQIVLWDAHGQQRVEIVNATGTVRGTQTIDVPANGVYIINVMADGAWSFELGAP